MAKYYYNKYNAVTVATFKSTPEGQATTSTYNDLYLYTDYAYNHATNMFEVNTQIKIFNGGYPEANSVSYGAIGDTQTSYAVNGLYKVVWLYGRTYDYYISTGSATTPGDLVEQVVALDGTYPSYGVGSDGYFYIKGSIASKPPTMPGGFTSPTSAVERGASTLISWTSSTDPEGGVPTYELDVKEIRGTTSSVWKPTYTNISGPSVSYTIPTDTTLTGIQFRVRAKNAYLYSDYLTSSALLVTSNKIPEIVLNTEDKLTLYENSILKISGTALDGDSGNVVSVKFSINGGTARAIASGISDGVSSISFSPSLTLKSSSLYAGDTVIVSNLADNTDHTLSVWAEDDKGGKSTVAKRTFRTVSNRPPVITVDEIIPEGNLDTDSFLISGTVLDLDGNTITLKRKLNNGELVNVDLVDGNFSFSVNIGSLNIGENEVKIEATDSFNAVTSKIIKLSKNKENQSILNSVVRYKAFPPTGSAKGIVLWVQRDKNLRVNVEASLTNSGEAESFAPMNLTATVNITDTIVEDQYAYELTESKTDIKMKLGISRDSIDTSDKIRLISGVLD